MKKGLILLFCLTIFASGIKISAQETFIDGFWGIPFGSSQTEVMRLMLAKDGVSFSVGDGSMLVFDVIKFADVASERVMFVFFDDAFFSATVFFKPNRSFLRDFNFLKESYLNKHGEPFRAFESMVVWKIEETLITIHADASREQVTIAYMFFSEEETISTYEPVPNGFWGIPFGSSRAEVRRQMTAREGVSFNRTHTDGSLIFNAVSFAGREVESILLDFVDDKFYTAFVFFVSRTRSQANILYTSLLNDLTNIYGVPETFIDSFDRRVVFWLGETSRINLIFEPTSVRIVYTNFVLQNIKLRRERSDL